MFVEFLISCDIESYDIRVCHVILRHKTCLQITAELTNGIDYKFNDSTPNVDLKILVRYRMLQRLSCYHFAIMIIK